jgi:hypothetical protein
MEVILGKNRRTQKYSSVTFLVNSEIRTYIDAAHTTAHNRILTFLPKFAKTQIVSPTVLKIFVARSRASLLTIITYLVTRMTSSKTSSLNSQKEKSK